MTYLSPPAHATLHNSTKSMPRIRCSFLFLLLLLFLAAEMAEAGKRRIHITDDLDDVIDDEEDEAWKEWGKKRSTTTNPSESDPDFSKMSEQEIQAHMMKNQFGPVFGFAKLRPGIRRTPEIVAEIAKKWTKIARTGPIEAKFNGFDLGTIMFTTDKGQDFEELKEFLLSQEEAYEIKMGEQLFRREGDPPLEQVVEELRSKKSKADQISSSKEEKHQEL